MTAHPLDTIIQTGNPVSKGDLKDYARKTFLADNAAHVANTDLAGTLFVLCPVSTGLGLFVYDSTDTISAQDVAAGVLRSNDDRVYKRDVLAAEDIQGLVLAAITGAGGLDAAHISAGDANTLLGRNDTGSGASLSTGNLVALLDGFLGGASWRTASAAFDASKVRALPENRWSGYATSYVLMADGRVRAAGIGTASANGIESGNSADRFMAVGTEGGAPVFSKIWSGGAQCYALDENGHLWSMGRNQEGQLGLGDTVNRPSFNEIEFFRINGLTVVDVALGLESSASERGATFAVFLASNGKAYFTGINDLGQAGVGTLTAATAPVVWGSSHTAGGVTNIDKVWAFCSSNNGVVLVSRSNGDVLGAGYDAFGAMGLGSGPVSRQTPAKLTAVSNVVQVASNGATIAYRVNDGTLKIGGLGSSGERGDGTTDTKTTPDYSLQTVSLGGACLDVQMHPTNTNGFVAAIVETAIGERTLKMWGANSSGQLGTGDTTLRVVPYETVDAWNGTVDEVFIGGGDQTASVFVKVGQSLYSVGYNGNRNLVRSGTGTSNAASFGLVSGLRGAIEGVHCPGYSTRGSLFVKTDQAVFAGGPNWNGKLGIGASQDILVSTLQEIETPNPTTINPIYTPPEFTVATLPSADAYGKGVQVFVSDETGGAVTAFTDGTNWRRVTDRVIVS
ncbi:MAG: hypothetical protein AAF234_15935 [Pseudomonadota bacterium]